MTNHRRTLIAAVCLALLIGVYFAWNPSETPRVGLFLPDDQQMVAQGKVIYTEQCASCHGDNLEGEQNWRQPKANGRMPAPPHDETGHTWHHSDQQLFKITKFGLASMTKLKDYQTDMPIYEDVLTDEEIIAVLSFIKAQWNNKIREQHDEFNRRHSARNQ
ncbi:MAG: c-type cytochrome [Rhizobiaceae bacterium]